MPSGSDGSGLHKLNIQRDGHFVANENAARLEGRVPGQAEVLPISLRGCRGRDPGIAPGILRWRGWAFDCKHDFARDTANAASMEASTREFARSNLSCVNTPLTLENWPFSLEIIMCLTLNSAVE